MASMRRASPIPHAPSCAHDPGRLSDNHQRPTLTQRQARELSSIRRRLLGWYRHHRRDLPWRRTDDAYAIWVSEIMLQQTTVASAISHWERWMERFPTVEDLALAREEEVLTLWSGLGYYNRARNLHQAAKRVVKEHGGNLPTDLNALLDLPGIGRYTAGAIASIAFGQRVPIVDANVARVVSRLFAVQAEATSTTGQEILWDYADQLAQTTSPGDLNQALMELGALVCSPTSPKCSACPVQTLCKAFRQGNPERFPVLPPKRETVEVTEVGAVIEREGKLLIMKRPDKGRFAGMWEFPHGPVRECEPQEALEAIMRDLTGLAITPEEHLITLDHVFTHHQITLHVWRASVADGRVYRREHADHKWIEPETLDKFPMSTPQRQIVEALRETGKGRQLDLLV